MFSALSKTSSSTMVRRLSSSSAVLTRSSAPTLSLLTATTGTAYPIERINMRTVPFSTAVAMDVAVEPSPARRKLMGILEAYRQQNFEHTLYSRYIKAMVHAIDTNHDGKISFHELQKLLIKMGEANKAHQQALMTDEELWEVIDELGQPTANGDKLIHCDYVEDLFLAHHDSIFAPSAKAA